MKKILAVLLAALCCVSCFVSCEKKDKGEELCLTDGGTILYEKDLVEESVAKDLAKEIGKKTGTEPKVVSDKSFIGGIRASEGTIILGCPDYEIAQNAMVDLREKDYICGVYGGRYLIGAKTADAVKKAITYFKNEVLANHVGEDGRLVVNSLENYRFNGDYRLDSLTIGGVGVHEFSIRTPKNPSASEQRTALTLQRILRNKTGYTLPILKGGSGEGKGEFLIGASLCRTAVADKDHGYDLRVSGTVMEMTAESFYGYLALQDLIMGSRLFPTKEKALALGDDTHFTGDGKNEVEGTLQSDGDVRMMFHNIWGGTDFDNEQRAGMMVEIYTEYLPDIIGLQEFAPHLRALIVPALQKLGYAEVPQPSGSVFYGTERATRNPVFYRTETLELLQAGHECLAVMDFGKYPDLLGGFTVTEVKNAAKGDRSKGVTWGIFRTKQDGKVFLAGSTHLWWQDGAVHDIARVVQMQEMRNLLTDVAAKFMSAKGLSGTMPIFVGGDYNTRSIRDSYHSMGRETPFDAIHTYLPVHQRPQECTTHEYPKYNEETGFWEKGGTPWADYSYALDYIFANRAAKSAFEVIRMEMLQEEYAFATSDHSPIFADLSFSVSAPTLPAQ